MERIINKIKEKKELSDLPESLVSENLALILKRHNLKSIPEKEKSQKEIVKEVRAELRKYTGRFQVSSRKREKMLSDNEIEQILKTHASTRERLHIYPKLIEIIKSLNPSSILDLGSGLNPIAIADKINAYYYAYDIKASEVDLINNYFRKKGIKGEAKEADIRNMDNFPKVDLTLIFKTLDIIETKGHKYAHKIMQNLTSNNIIVSFSTRTLSGKPMKSTRRAWFESILTSLNYKFKIEIFSGEIFYLIEKPSRL